MRVSKHSHITDLYRCSYKDIIFHRESSKSNNHSWVPIYGTHMGYSK